MNLTTGWWRDRAAEARARMVAAPRTHRVLIEAAAQHPLEDGERPGPEFRARLDRATELASQYFKDGWEVAVYIPGSRHRDEDHVDARSLSSAGVSYLEPRVPVGVVLHGDDLNDRYLAADGVYGSADECYVSASYFSDGRFERLLAVVSPQQLPRKLLHYLAFGVEPLLHTAPVAEPYHDVIVELTESVPEVLSVDPTAQGVRSPIGRRLRRERRP